jgi:NAD(P)H-hydrate repair Nnr-like enzyme with NAD(P)H-hydrate epimerase domain
MNLTTQCEKMDIPFLSYLPSDAQLIHDSYNLVIDALFGFSFRPPARPEFATIIAKIKETGLPVISIDVPSGMKQDLRPSVLVHQRLFTQDGRWIKVIRMASSLKCSSR